MATLKEIAEVAYRKIFPKPSDETPVSREEFLSTAKTEYAYHIWRTSKEMGRAEGMFDVPAHLLISKEFDVKDNKVDMSGVETLVSLDNWIQNIGGVECSCRYVKRTINQQQIFCDDDSLDDHDRPYYLVGMVIYFPNGVHAEKIPITYARSIGDIDADKVHVDDMVGSIVRNRLEEIYLGKVGTEDPTNNSTSII